MAIDSTDPVLGHRSRIVTNAAQLHRARYRRERGQTLIEGPHLLEEAIKTGVAVEAVFASGEDRKTPVVALAQGLTVHQVDHRALARLAGTETPRGPMAVIEIPWPELRRDTDVLVSCGVSDPGNVGTLIRTAASFGWSYATLAGSADPWSPKTVRAGAGGHFHTTISTIAGLEDLEGWIKVATVVEGGVDPAKVRSGRTAVLVGSESSGLGEDVISASDIAVTIPTAVTVESLNAAAAAAIVVYELSKARGLGEAEV